MNIRDLIMCTFAFSKYSDTPEIWQKLEDGIKANLRQFKLD